MGNILKSLALILILIMAISSLIIVESVDAQSIPKPSFPEFSLKYVDHSYDVAPTYSLDPYTGQNVTTNTGYHVENKSIEIIIKNQPYSYSYNGSSVWLVYNVQIKGHFGESWTVLYSFDKYTGGNLPIQSSSGFTVISVPADNYQVGGQVDFQAQALTEYQTQLTVYPHIGTTSGAYDVTGYATGETSGWSNTQTITIPATSTSTSPSPTATVPELSPLAILPFILSILLIAFVLKHKNNQSIKNCRKLSSKIN